jgi:hypothetical protein
MELAARQVQVAGATRVRENQVLRANEGLAVVRPTTAETTVEEKATRPGWMSEAADSIVGVTSAVIAADSRALSKVGGIETVQAVYLSSGIRNHETQPALALLAIDAADSRLRVARTDPEAETSVQLSVINYQSCSLIRFLISVVSYGAPHKSKYDATPCSVSMSTASWSLVWIALTSCTGTMRQSYMS